MEFFVYTNINLVYYIYNILSASYKNGYIPHVCVCFVVVGCNGTSMTGGWMNPGIYNVNTWPFHTHGYIGTADENYSADASI